MTVHATRRKKTMAADIMRTKVITLSPDLSTAEAIEVFEENKIGGAPVVDAAGRLLGVLTVSDIARKEHLVDGRLATERAEYYLVNPLDEEGWLEDEDFSGLAGYNSDATGPECVRDWMTPKVISVTPDAPLEAICKVMAGESIHRVLVVEDGVLLGIVSTFDIVRHLAER